MCFLKQIMDMPKQVFLNIVIQNSSAWLECSLIGKAEVGIDSLLWLCVSDYCEKLEERESRDDKLDVILMGLCLSL